MSGASGVWRGADLGPRANWAVPLPPEALDQIAANVVAVQQAGFELRDIDAARFPLPAMADILERARRDILSGPGFALFTGLDVTRYDREQLGIAFVGIGAHLGTSVSQSHRGDYLGDVINWAEDGNERPYRRGGILEMHCDPVDIVGLCCRQHAKSGGLSRIADALAVRDELRAEAPELLARLQQGYQYYRPIADRGDSDPLTERRIPVFGRDASGAELSWFIPGLILDGADKAQAPFTQADRAALALFNEIANRPGVFLDMQLNQGDMQFLNNRRIVHGRTDYEDWPEFERKRHMLRLWLMVPDWPMPTVALNPFDNDDRLGGGIAARVA